MFSSQEQESLKRQSLSAEQVERLIVGLDSLVEGALGVSLLIACGEDAIPPLRRFLLFGSPRSIYVGRQRAVKALSGLNAASVLMEYLLLEKQIHDPIVRYSEEAVESTAARELAKWKTEEVFKALLTILKRKPLPGAVEAIGVFQRKEAVPGLIRCLEDDVARPLAEGALLALRELAKVELIATTRLPEPWASRELASSLLRRRSALRILVSGRVTAAEWEQLRFLMFDRDPTLSLRAAGLALAMAAQPDISLATRITIDRLCAKDWFVVAEAEQILLENFDLTCSAVETEITRQGQLHDVGSKKVVAILKAIARCGEAA